MHRSRLTLSPIVSSGVKCGSIAVNTAATSPSFHFTELSPCLPLLAVTHFKVLVTKVVRTLSLLCSAHLLLSSLPRKPSLFHSTDPLLPTAPTHVTKLSPLQVTRLFFAVRASAQHSIHNAEDTPSYRR
jgi:hypothetical protein